ncbi:armadillo-type protein [Immersiella caudata]|uniref:Armadillo-type protein n=1 Tax=Immersiella caudata TaxID=314043 RepID=A0AA39X2R3_9PEZI|nr:armadillo-type protein [Immersiella caudata]
MDDFFRSQQSPRGDPQMSAFASPPRNGPQLPRRFTTDSGRVPTLSSITTAQRGPEPQDFTATTLEKKRMDYERLREHKRRFEAEIHKLDAQQRMEERELALMQEDLNVGRFGGHQSEPTTPPEYRETSAGFPTMFSRPNRYSTSSLTSPPGIFNRPGRSGSQLASPQSGIMQSRFAFDDQLPSRSVPGSRRNSDEDEKEEAVRQDPTSHRSTNALNRYSMPVTRSRTYLTDIGLEDSNNTTGFLFGDEDSNSGENRTTPTNNPDSFPALLRQQGYGTLLSSTSSTALDLAQSQPSASESTSTNGWNSISKHRSQQSMSTIGSTPLNGAASPPEVSAIGSRPASIRHSMDGAMKYFPDSSSGASDATPTLSVVSPQTSHILATPPKLQQSYSANDVPTVKSANVTPGMGVNANNHAQQHFHNHNASLGRIPAGAIANRHSRELSNDSGHANGRENGGYPSIGSTLQASAMPFGPTSILPQSSAPMAPAVLSPAAANHYPYYSGTPVYSPHAGNAATYGNLPMLMQGMALGSTGPSPVPAAMYQAPQGFTGYGALYQSSSRPQPQDSQARVIRDRRAVDNEAMARFNGMSLEQARGRIYDLCKDQHGCRFLQKQLENRQPEQIHLIWSETNMHVVELMTDPFGNYLCQKLLEYCDDDERTVLIQNASEAMVRIALNQHGTRALQKMIEHVSTAVQIKLIIDSLRHQVVELIQDLNGNHVIQKCLNKLSADDAAFIFEAVGNHCVEVGTHRHGCCVLQRCIDHADGAQKVWLIERITDNAVTLVQDPFGNYVVQYIIDLNQDAFTEPLVRQFQGRTAALSRHKFSSNVIEKCLRCASDTSKDMIVDELLMSGEMLNLLRDSFANYVIQTALEYSTTGVKIRLVEAIRPVLPNIRATPYGRRIQAKIQAYDTRAGTRESVGPSIPPITDATGAQISTRTAHQRILPPHQPSHQQAHQQAHQPIMPPPQVAYTNGTNGNGANLNGINGINGVNMHGVNVNDVNSNGLGNGLHNGLNNGVGGYANPGGMPAPQPPRGQQYPPQYQGMGGPTDQGESWL